MVIVILNEIIILIRSASELLHDNSNTKRNNNTKFALHQSFYIMIAILKRETQILKQDIYGVPNLLKCMVFD